MKIGKLYVGHYKNKEDWFSAVLLQDGTKNQKKTKDIEVLHCRRYSNTPKVIGISIENFCMLSDEFKKDYNETR